MRITRFVLGLVAALCFSTAVAQEGGAQEGGAPAGGTEQPPILLGVAGPFTGPSAQFGVQIRYGATMAQEAINEKGGIGGRKLELVFEDDAAQQNEANKVALKLASTPNVLAVVGHFNSSCSLAARNIYADAGLVMISPGSTNATVTLGLPNTFRNLFTDEFQGDSIARLIHENFKFERAAVIYENDDYGRGLFEFFKTTATSLGVNVVAEKAYDRDTTDFRPLLNAIQKMRPQVLVISGLYQQAGLITRQAREMGLPYLIIGSDGVFSDKFVEIAGKASEGVLVTTPFVFDDTNARAKEFADKVQARFQAAPDAWAALSYDAVNLLVHAIEKSSADKKAIMDYMGGMTTKDRAFDGLTGPTYFDDEGDCVKPVMVSEIRDGKFVMAKEQLQAK